MQHHLSTSPSWSSVFSRSQSIIFNLSVFKNWRTDYELPPKKFSNRILTILIRYGEEAGSKSPNMAMAIEDEDSIALLPFGSASAIGSFIQLPHCGIPRPTSTFPFSSSVFLLLLMKWLNWGSFWKITFVHVWKWFFLFPLLKSFPNILVTLPNQFHLKM